MTPEKIQSMLNELLSCIERYHVDTGFNRPIYHYDFSNKAVDIVKKYMENI